MSYAQQITHGPIVGGVTESAANIYVRTNQPATVEIRISKTSAFTSYQSAYFATSAIDDNSEIFAMPGLTSNTEYHYKLFINGIQQGNSGSFSTFPQSGESSNYSLLFGSCIDDTTSDAIFTEMLNHRASMFFQTGDWIYSDEYNDPWNEVYFANSYYKVQQAYREKYTSVNQSKFLLTTPVDYVYDDHDFVNNNATKDSCTEFGFSFPNVTVESYFIPSNTRSNAIKGYVNHFPGYPMVDTAQGIYHKVQVGNIDIFVTDNRSSRTNNASGLRKINGDWSFVPDTSHKMYGDEQMQWLLNGLKLSTADWKIIVSGVVFNKSWRDAIQELLDLPGFVGFPFAAAMIDTWAGYPDDQDSLLSFIENNCINNVVVVSGDSHTSAIDDGTFSGLPEMMAANLHKGNSMLGYWIRTLLNVESWSQGGQGIGNSNYNNTFGKIETFSGDSLKMSIIDVDGTVVTSAIIPATKNTTISLSESLSSNCNSNISVLVSGGKAPYQYSLDGISYQLSNTFTDIKPGTYTIYIKDYNHCIFTDNITISGANLTIGVSTDTVGSQLYMSVGATGGSAPYFYLWNNGYTSSTLVNPPAGDYTVWVTDANGCTDSIVFSYPSIITGPVSVVQPYNDFSISPNPVKESFSVHIDLPIKQDFSIQILDPEGRQIQKFDFQNQSSASITNNLPNFAKGIYFVQLSTPNFSIVKRLLKINY